MTSVGQESHLVEIEGSPETVQEYFEERGWSDGLPIVLPTQEAVQAMLSYSDRPPGDVVAHLAPRNGAATVELIAVNAVMAGCRPQYLPVIMAAVQAVADPAFNLNAIQSTTHPCAVLVFLNGPIGRELGINSGSNCFGQGWRANATIGRAMRLILLNIGGGIPGDGDRATHGSPAKYSYCAAENESENPWQPLHVERGFAEDDSVVTVMGAEGPHNINDHASVHGEGLLTTVAMSMRQLGSNNMSGRGGEPMVVLGPEHAAQIAADGYTKDDVKRFVWERSRFPIEDAAAEWRQERLGRTELQQEGDDQWLPVATHWSRMNVVVAGGPGKHSCWIPTFGGSTETVTRRIERRDGTPLRSVDDIRSV
jgi:hypothetical protein